MASLDAQSYLRGLRIMSDLPQFRAIGALAREMLAPRAGERILDVGCGAGDEVRALARHVGSAGAAIGLDSQPAMIEAARSCTGDAPAEFLLGDAHHLPFDDDSLDACRAERVLQHLERPERALAEMVRVTRSGGRVLVADVDWGMAALDSGEREVTRRLLDFACDGIRHGWLGRQLPGLFAHSGLHDVRIVPRPMVFDRLDAANREQWQRMAGRARAAGVITADEATRWLADIDRRADEGYYCAVVAVFIAIGYKP